MKQNARPATAAEITEIVGPLDVAVLVRIARDSSLRAQRRVCAARFAPDSPLEGDGLEPSVPVASEPVYIAEGELRGDRRGSQKNLAGYRWFESISLQQRVRCEPVRWTPKMRQLAKVESSRMRCLFKSGSSGIGPCATTRRSR
jgi:hypothetical protein